MPGFFVLTGQPNLPFWFASINLPHVVRCVFECVGLTRLIAGRLRLPLASASLRLGSGLPAVSPAVGAGGNRRAGLFRGIDRGRDLTSVLRIAEMAFMTRKPGPGPSIGLPLQLSGGTGQKGSYERPDQADSYGSQNGAFGNLQSGLECRSRLKRPRTSG